MQDVKAAADDAQKAYEARSRKSKAQLHLAAFSSRVMYYGVIMDTLSQHHPEYVSLAWGAVKFLFVVRYLLLDHTCVPCSVGSQCIAGKPGTSR